MNQRKTKFTPEKWHKRVEVTNWKRLEQSIQKGEKNKQINPVHKAPAVA